MKNFRGIITWGGWGEREGEREREIQTTTSVSLYTYACVSSTEWKTTLQSVFMIPVYHSIISLSGPHI